MSDDFLGGRKRGLEDAFFAEQDAILRRRLNEADKVKAQRQALAEACGIEDDAVLDSLASHGVTAETMTAIMIVPLVAVAWADGSIDDKERAAVLSGAAQFGLAPGNTGHALLEGWLSRRPPADLLQSWKSYVGALAPALDEATRTRLKNETLSRARAVAEAAGGLMGFGRKVSDAEQAVLTELERGFAA